jgi:hypothetical protein
VLVFLLVMVLALVLALVLVLVLMLALVQQSVSRVLLPPPAAAGAPAATQSASYKSCMRPAQQLHASPAAGLSCRR